MALSESGKSDMKMDLQSSFVVKNHKSVAEGNLTQELVCGVIEPVADRYFVLA